MQPSLDYQIDDSFLVRPPLPAALCVPPFHHHSTHKLRSRPSAVPFWRTDGLVLLQSICGHQFGELGLSSAPRLTDATLEATQGHIDGFLSQLAYKYHPNRVASVEE